MILAFGKKHFARLVKADGTVSLVKVWLTTERWDTLFSDEIVSVHIFFSLISVIDSINTFIYT